MGHFHCFEGFKLLLSGASQVPPFLQPRPHPALTTQLRYRPSNQLPCPHPFAILYYTKFDDDFSIRLECVNISSVEQALEKTFWCLVGTGVRGQPLPGISAATAQQGHLEGPCQATGIPPSIHMG